MCTKSGNVRLFLFTTFHYNVFVYKYQNSVFFLLFIFMRNIFRINGIIRPLIVTKSWSPTTVLSYARELWFMRRTKVLCLELNMNLVFIVFGEDFDVYFWTISCCTSFLVWMLTTKPSDNQFCNRNVKSHTNKNIFIALYFSISNTCF